MQLCTCKTYFKRLGLVEVSQECIPKFTKIRMLLLNFFTSLYAATFVPPAQMILQVTTLLIYIICTFWEIFT